MKKTACWMLLILLILSGAAGTAATAYALPGTEDAESRLPIVRRQPDGALLDTALYGIVRRHEVLVPLTLVTEHLKNDFSVDADNSGLVFNVASPAFDLETPRLTDFLKDGVDFRLGTVSVYGVPHINLRGLEKLLNISVGRAPNGQSLIVEQPAEPRSAKADGVTVRPRLHLQRELFRPVGRISLVWDHFLGDAVDLAREEKVSGLTVISPTWFAVTDARGTLSNKADWKYVQDAHDKGYKVWALVSNSFDPDMTRGFLADEAAQDRTVRQLLMYTALYDLDGINVDFENIYDDDRDRLTAFVAKLADKLREQRVVLSLDATVPSGVPMWSNCFDRASLAKLVDYFMVMTYDEHWRTSPVAGSVASIGWVERGIVSTLQYVPKEKLLMGLPFYTREWRETDNGYGQVRVRSSTMWMSDVENRIVRHGLTPVWLDAAGQHYIEYADENYRYKVWIEDAKSLALKTELAKKYDLAGVAAWRKGFEKPGTWDAIHLALGKTAEPVRADPSEQELTNWSLKSLMEKLKGSAGKGVSE